MRYNTKVVSQYWDSGRRIMYILHYPSIAITITICAYTAGADPKHYETSHNERVRNDIPSDWIGAEHPGQFSLLHHFSFLLLKIYKTVRIDPAQISRVSPQESFDNICGIPVGFDILILKSTCKIKMAVMEILTCGIVITHLLLLSSH